MANKKTQQGNISQNIEQQEKVDENSVAFKLKINFLHMFSIFLFHGTQFVFHFLMYIGYKTSNYYLITLLICIYAYQLSPFCKKQKWFMDFLQVPLQVKYFKNWTCTKEEPILEKKSMLAAHPHGMLVFGFFMNCYEHYPQTLICGSRMIMSLPLGGMFMRWCGGTSVDPANLTKLLKKGQSVGILPGGFEEATLTTQKENRAYIKKRKGFIKYAIKYGYTVYPVFVFGENQLYTIFEPFLKLRMFLNKFKLPGVIFYSNRGIFPSNNASLHTVIGKGLKWTQNDKPTNEEIQSAHQQYVEALTDLYNRNKDKYNEKSELKLY